MASTRKAERLTQAALAGFQSAVDSLSQAALIHEEAAAAADARGQALEGQAFEAYKEAGVQESLATAARERALRFASLIA